MDNTAKLINDESPSSHSPDKPKILTAAKEAQEQPFDEILIERYNVNGAIVELIRKPRTIYAGKTGYADVPGVEPNIGYIWAQMYHYDENSDEWKNPADRRIIAKLPPEWDVCISINYWKSKDTIWGMMFAREVEDENQPEGIDITIVPEGLYIRVKCDKASGKLIGKDSIPAPYEMFGYIREKFAPEHGYTMNVEGQEYEYRPTVNDADGNRFQYSYIPVVKN